MIELHAKCAKICYNKEERYKVHEGHRQRMLERLQQNGAMQDHELLEILLFNAIPRKNTNELAHRLLQAFGGLDGLLRADMNDLVHVEGVGPSTAAYLHSIGLIYSRAEEERRRIIPIFNSMHDFSDFIVARFRGLSEEFIELFCLDSKGRVGFCKRYSSGQKDGVTVSPEEINRFLVEHKPHSLVIAHNHPDGTASPSAQDDAFTVQAQMICSMNNVFFSDHVIVAGEALYSYFFVGRMHEIRKNYQFSNITLKGKLQ